MRRVGRAVQTSTTARQLAKPLRLQRFSQRSLHEHKFDVEAHSTPASRWLTTLGDQRASSKVSVHSVFQRCVNLRVDGEILSLLAANQASTGLNLTPNSLGVRTGQDLRQLGWNAGDALAVSSSSPRDLRLSSSSAAVALNLAASKEWSPLLEPVRSPAAPVDRARRMRHALHTALSADSAAGEGFAPILLALAHTDGLQLPAAPAWPAAADPSWPLLARSAYPRILSLVQLSLEQARRSDAAAACETARSLVGLGAGLTPSGDDFLVGFLAGAVASGHEAVGALSSELARAATLAQTTDVAASFLRHAARNEFSASVQGVALALLQQQLDAEYQAARPGAQFAAVERETNRLLSFGATSGADCLLGVLSGVSASWSTKDKR